MGGRILFPLGTRWFLPAKEKHVLVGVGCWLIMTVVFTVDCRFIAVCSFLSKKTELSLGALLFVKGASQSFEKLMELVSQSLRLFAPSFQKPRSHVSFQVLLNFLRPPFPKKRLDSFRGEPTRAQSAGCNFHIFRQAAALPLRLHAMFTTFNPTTWLCGPIVLIGVLVP